jgi:flavin reductase (DIM6/NTAB) family NADH-FMN oxidoreductase RutF
MRPFAAFVDAVDPAMVIVTAAAGAERDGCLVGFHAQCSIEPPRYAVWLSVANRTCDIAQRSRCLGVHLLGDGDGDLAELFGGETGDEVDKLARCEWVPGPDGVPLLGRCPTRFVGRVVETVAGVGDHDLFVLDVIDAARGEVSTPLRLSTARRIEPGHEATERR